MSVVISACGAACGFGFGNEALRTGLAEGRSAVGQLDESVAGFGPGFGAPVPVDRKVLRGLPGGKALRPSTMSRLTWLTAVGLGLAMQDAGLDPSEKSPERSVLVGSQTNMPDMARHLRFWRSAGAEGKDYKLDSARLQEGMRVFGAFEFLRLMNNMPGAHAALQSGALGSVNTLLGGASTGLAAVVRGNAALAAGEAAEVLAGGIGSAVNEHRSLHRRAQGFWLDPSDSPEACKPYSSDSRGSIPGEGAAFVLLEGEERAEQAGRPTLARVLLGETGFCPSASSGAAIAGLLRNSMDRVGVDPADIAQVVGTGSGVPGLDTLELSILAELGLGERNPRSLVPQLGFCEAASGALSLVDLLLNPRTSEASGGLVLALSVSPEGNFAVLLVER